MNGSPRPIRYGDSDSRNGWGYPVTTPSPSRQRSTGPMPLSLEPPHRHGHGRSSLRPMLRAAGQTWASQQESKFRVLGIPKHCWIKDIYQTLGRYGSIVRIEIKPSTKDNMAWVIFQPPPHMSIEDNLVKISNARVRIEWTASYIPKVPSPINASKEYYERNILFANSIDFGFTVSETTMMVMRTARAKGGIQMALNLKRKQIDIHLPVEIGGRLRKCRLELPFSLLSDIHRVTEDGSKDSALVIPFQTSPRFFMQVEDLLGAMGHAKDHFWTEMGSWYRQTDIIDEATAKMLRKRPLTNHKEGAVIDIGQWTTYRVSFASETLNGPQFGEFMDALSDYGVCIKASSGFAVKDRVVSPLQSLLQDEVLGTHPHLETSLQGLASEQLLASQVNLTFQVRYQLEVCLSNGYLREHNITREFLDRLSSMKTNHAVYILEKVAEKQKILYDPMEIFQVPLKGPLEKEVPNYCILSRSVNITPTMMHVSTPIMEMSNRIVRQYAAVADRFIRVKFSDEKTEGRIRGERFGKNEALFTRIRHAMTEGIVVAGRYYQFLAFGNSQFRENGAYFYAPNSSKSADDIRLSLGQFDHIKTVAKFGSRIGQCFSTTRALTMRVKIEKIPDIEHNGFNFSDGVGKLSLFVAQMAAQELGYPNAFEDPPSLYQFRLAGCKGVLALDPKLTGSVVHIRPSQSKFEAPHTGLEIIRASAFATAYFNRQIIPVLSTLGVPDEVFIKKQKENIELYKRAMVEEDIAWNTLKNRVDMHQVSMIMAYMVEDGFMKCREPFMMSLLQLWRAFHIKGLKEKARIAIEDGAFVLGCVDETATLRGHYDDPQSNPNATREERLNTLPEIFLQITDTSRKGYYKVVKGVCLLARNPSLHPGDIRVVRAVDVPSLRHLKNVVVLPQKGDRDIANMCSGGDLDGDDYMVLWDSELIPRVINERPMDFTPEKPIESDEPITIRDVIDFFVTYMKNDSLGQIATAHVAQADYSEEGVNDPKCLELAILHSRAVDYPKSGIPAIMDYDLKPFKWPHFMERKFTAEKNIYRSKKVLGQLYDQVQFVDFKPQYENPFDNRILNAFAPEEAVIDRAADIKANYDLSLKRLMAKNDIRTEFEAWSVFALAHNDGRDYKFAEEFGGTVEALKAQFRATCRTSAGVAIEPDHSRLARFVAAMYTATAREMESALRECREVRLVSGEQVPLRNMDPESMPFISFPWLFASELGKIATGKSDDRPSLPVTRSLMSKSKKRADASQTITPDVLETDKGVTHYGEMLNLDFGSNLLWETAESLEVGAPNVSPLPADSPVTEDMVGVGKDEKTTYAGDDKANIPKEAGIASNGMASASMDNAGSRQEVGSSNQTPPAPFKTDMEPGTSEKGNFDVESTRLDCLKNSAIEVKIDFDKRKPSALDKLSRLG